MNWDEGAASVVVAAPVVAVPVVVAPVIAAAVAADSGIVAMVAAAVVTDVCKLGSGFHCAPSAGSSAMPATQAHLADASSQGEGSTDGIGTVHADVEAAEN